MSPLLMIWFFCASIVARGSYYDLQSEDKLKWVDLFQNKDDVRITYVVNVK